MIRHALIPTERVLWPVLAVLLFVLLVAWNLQPTSGPVLTSSQTCWTEASGIVCGNPSTAPEGSEWVR